MNPYTLHLPAKWLNFQLLYLGDGIHEYVQA